MISQQLVEAHARFARVREYVLEHQYVFAEFEARGGLEALVPGTILCVIDGNCRHAREVAEYLGAPCPDPIEGYHNVGLLVVRKGAFDGCPFRDELDREDVGTHNALVFFEEGIQLTAIVFGTARPRVMS